MKPTDIHPGLVLHVINSHGLGAPRGTLATTEIVGTSSAGDWLYTIRYHDKRDTRGGRLYRSHLWAVDLGCFEVAVKEEQRPAYIGISKTAAIRAAKRAQLSLPFEDEREDNPPTLI